MAYFLSLVYLGIIFLPLDWFRPDMFMWNWSGISLKTQELYALVFATRYLDIFTTYISLYNTVMKLIFLGSSFSIVWYMRNHKVVRQSYDRDHDTFRHYFLVLPCFGLALLINDKFTFREVIFSYLLFLSLLKGMTMLIMLSKGAQQVVSKPQVDRCLECMVFMKYYCRYWTLIIMLLSSIWCVLSLVSVLPSSISLFCLVSFVEHTFNCSLKLMVRFYWATSYRLRKLVLCLLSDLFVGWFLNATGTLDIFLVSRGCGYSASIGSVAKNKERWQPHRKLRLFPWVGRWHFMCLLAYCCPSIKVETFTRWQSEGKVRKSTISWERDKFYTNVLLPALEFSCTYEGTSIWYLWNEWLSLWQSLPWVVSYKLDLSLPHRESLPAMDK